MKNRFFKILIKIKSYKDVIVIKIKSNRKVHDSNSLLLLVLARVLGCVCDAGPS